MARQTRMPRAQVLALPRPQPAVSAEWLVAAIAAALVLFGLVL